MRAVQRIDLAAGGGDFGLHDQRAGHAPGGKVAHLGVVGGEGADHPGGYSHRAGIIGDGAGTVGGGGGLDRVCVVQRDGDHREGAGVGAQRHVDGSRRVVGDDQGLGIVGDQIVALFKEGDVASVAEDDLPGQTDSGVNGGVILCAAWGVHVNVFVAACDCGQLRAAGVGLVIENRLAVVEGHRGAGQTGVVGGGNAQTVDVGAGAAAGVHVDVLDIELLLIVRQHIGEVVGVARGDGNHRFGVYHGVGELVQGGLVGCGVGEALDRAAEGEVHRVAAENDGVLDGDHVVGIVSAAACAEDLHNEELRVGSHADGVNGFRCVRVGVAVLDEAVGCRNTRHVRAVLALGVAQVVDSGVRVHVVVAEGDLLVEVGRAGAVELILDRAELVGGKEADALSGLLNGVAEGVRIHGPVGRVQTGVDDGDAGARAGVAFGPGALRPDHVFRGVGGVRAVAVFALCRNGRVVAVFRENVFDAGNGLDLRNVAVADVRGDRVHRKGNVPLDVQRGAGGGLDPGGQGVLAAAQAPPVGNRLGVFGDAIRAVACVKGGGPV